MRTSRHDGAAERKRKLVERKRRIAYRLRDRNWEEQPRPMFAASNIHYDLARRDRGLGEGGIGAMHLLARRVGLIVCVYRFLEYRNLVFPEKFVRRPSWPPLGTRFPKGCNCKFFEKYR